MTGNPDAPIEIVEFADFACAFCAQFARETLPVIRREWIDTGRARLPFVPFDLSFFRPGGNATRAAECAAAQVGFWPMHDLLYARQEEWLGHGSDCEAFRACHAAVARRRP